MRHLFFFLLIICFSSCMFRQKVDMIVHHAHIYTVDEKFSVAEAMAIRDGKILETGSSDDILKKYSSDSMMDAGGKAIFPGLIDAHCHFTGFATDQWKCNLTGTGSWNEILDSVRVYAEHAPMEWIYGRGWDQNDWEVKTFPDKSKLDSLFPDRPVFLKRVDGHAAIVNSVALQRANITSASTINGGLIEMKNGAPTGLLVDNAMDLVEHVIPAISDSLALQYLQGMQFTCFSEGLTGVHDCGISEHTLGLLEKAQENGKLDLNIFALLSDDSTYYDRWIKKGRYENKHITMGGFKLYADGALGSRGACLIHDYSDKPGWKGFLLSDSLYFVDKAKRLAASNLQMCTHAIGDSGNRIILKIYADALKGPNDRRWRIEHAQVINDSDFHFFKDFSIIPSVQPTHATSDMYWATDRLGAARMQGAYAYKRLLQTNGWIPLGTDFPVEYISPMKTFYAAVIRKDAKGFPANGFQTENALSREEAIRGMTTWAAKAAFQEKEQGMLKTGMAANFIMVDNDLMQCDPSKILGTKVLYTFVNGKKVFSKN